MLLDNILQLKEYEVMHAKDGEEAIGLFKDNPDTKLIFASWNLPRVSGGELAKTIKANESDMHPYIFFTTERGSDRTLIDALSAGADDIIFKPYVAEVVESRIDRAIQEMETGPSTGFDPIDELVREHCFIQRVVNTFQVIASKMHEDVPENILEWINDTSLTMERQVHHKKEMHYLVGFLEKAICEHGEDPDDKLFARASLKSVEEEHKEIEKLFKKLQAEIASNLEGVSNVESIKKAIDDYAVLLRKHLRREERFLFPMSRRYIDEDLKKEMHVAFASVEKKAGMDKLKKMENRLDRVEKVLGIRGPKE